MGSYGPWTAILTTCSLFLKVISLHLSASFMRTARATLLIRNWGREALRLNSSLYGKPLSTPPVDGQTKGQVKGKKKGQWELALLLFLCSTPLLFNLNACTSIRTCVQLIFFLVLAPPNAHMNDRMRVYIILDPHSPVAAHLFDSHNSNPPASTPPPVFRPQPICFDPLSTVATGFLLPPHPKYICPYQNTAKSSGISS